MSRKKEIILLILSDFIFINLALAIYYYIRIESGWIAITYNVVLFLPLFVIYIYWLLTFVFAGLYQQWYVKSRFDEIAKVIKVVSIGCLFLFFVIFLDDFVRNSRAISRYLILIYWGLMISSVSFGRLIIRSIQINLLSKGFGLRNSLIIGSKAKSNQLFELVNKHRQLGYLIVGFIAVNYKSIDKKVLGDLKSLHEIIIKNNIEDILIALDPKEKDVLFEIIRLTPLDRVKIKIMPDIYEIVSGMVKTNQIYGVPLIEVTPEIPYSIVIGKRIIDIAFSIFLLFITFPLILVSIVLIKLTSKGPFLYKQIRVGKNGNQFKLYKFRSMTMDSETEGEQWAKKDDERTTFIGRQMRKVHFDEIPQLINILKNDMSLVGPRPERPHFVEMLSNEIPYYYKRLSVKPGLTGWAQVKHTYDSSLDDVRVKLQYDFYYIENLSIKMDFKILVNTILIIVLMKGR